MARWGAEDLKLGQPVALKFLPRGVEKDPDRLDRLLREVRTDGEDLASLLRRVVLSLAPSRPRSTHLVTVSVTVFVTDGVPTALPASPTRSNRAQAIRLESGQIECRRAGPESARG